MLDESVETGFLVICKKLYKNILYLVEIEQETYESFIKTQFIKDSRQVEESIITELLHWCRSQRGVDSLLQKEMIYQKKENFYVYDVFFSRWLEMQGDIHQRSNRRNIVFGNT